MTALIYLYITLHYIRYVTCTAWSMLGHLNVFKPFRCGFTYELYLFSFAMMSVKELC